MTCHIPPPRPFWGTHRTCGHLFKTAAKPKPREWIENYFVQAVAYACMFYELTNIPVKKLVIFMTCENGEVEIYEEYDKMKYMKLLVQYIEKFVEDKLNAR